jgi:PAS domain S-box-containing protein
MNDAVAFDTTEISSVGVAVEAPRTDSAERAARLSNSPILIVEDSRMQAVVMQDALIATGYRADCVASIAEGLAWLESNVPLLIVLDYRLPDGEAGLFLDALRSSNRSFPFIVTTARGSERIAVEMMKLGAMDYLVKDAKIAEHLAETVDRAVKRLQAEKALAEVRRSLQQAEARTRQIIDSAGDAFLSVDRDGNLVHWNPAAEATFGYRADEILGRSLLTIVPERRRAAATCWFRGLPDEPPDEQVKFRREATALHRDGREIPLELSVFPVRVGRTWTLSAFVRDISERRRLESQLVQSEKMASLGVLAAGVAHEINNPVGFVSSNLATLAEYVTVFSDLVSAYERRSAAEAAGDGVGAAAAEEEIAVIRRRDDLSAMRDDVGPLLSESSDGLRRVKEIVQNLRSFARLDESEVKDADLNECLETTLKVVSNELKYKAQIVKEFEPLPRIRCCAGQLNQVFVNLLINAGQAIKDRGRITIATRAEAEQIVIRIADTGEGISPENMSKLFTPFFTTKGVGKGTGLGLSISYGIVQKHGGMIEAASRPGEGAEFIIRLPRGGMTST